MDIYAELQRLGSLVRQLQGALGGKRILAGGITSSGTVNYGSGFSVSRTSAGVYPVTFTTAFPAAAGSGTVVQFDSDNGSALRVFWTAGSTTGFTANVQNTSGTATDAFVNFLVIG